MSDILLLDTGAVNRSISTGTKAAVEYFSAILQAAAAQGMRVELTDALYVEFRRSTVLRAILPELSAAGALGDSGVGVATSYAAQAANERLNNVIMPPDAGELSAFEYAQQCAKRGDVVTVFSDDAALFKNTAKLIDAGINPEFAEAITRNSSDMVAFVRANNAISAGESAAIYDVYTSIDQYNVSKAGKGWDPRQRFLAPSELEEILAKAPTPVVDYVQSFSRYAAKGIVIVGAAGLAYGLLTTAAKADDQIAAGDYEGAAATVASFGAGFAAALAAFEAGAAVGGACGSVAGPVGAAVGATLVGTAAAIIATGVAEEAAHAATQLLWSAVGSIFSTLEAVPQIISSVPSWFSMPLRAQLNSQFISPLVIDLTGGAIQTTALKGSQTFFDMAGIGHGQQTGWLSASCAFLARPNADGSITSISNLFGTDGSAANGFQSLAALDSNHDGKISAADAAFGSLVVWNDLNSDGVAETGETQTLAQVGVASISLSYATVATTSPAHMNNGNEIRQTSTVTMADGTTRVIADVWFATNPMMSQWAWHAPTAVQAALPDLPASGNLDSLQQSYANNPVLEQTAAALVAGASEMSYSDLRSAVEALVIQWARGSGAALPAGATLQQQRAAVMEAMGGQAFAVSMFNSDQQGLLAGGNVDHLYSMMLDTMTADIAMQVGSGVGGGSLSASVAAMFAGYAFDPATGDITPPASATLSQMQANGTFRQVLFQYMRDGAGAAPTTDAIWPLVAAWAANMPAGADLSQLVIDDNLGPFDVLSTSWSNDWAQPGIIDLMSKVSLPGQLPSIGFDARIGSDLFVYQKGAGDKVIWPWGGQMGAGTLYFADVSSKDVRIDGTGSSYRDLDGNIDKIDVTITILATGERVMLANPAFADGGIFTKIVLADGVVIDSAGFMALQNAVVFGKGDFGEVAAYTTKADTFVYASGDGAISIDAHLATGANVLKFADLNAANLTFTMDAAKNLIITDGVTGDRVTVLGQFTGATKIASFAFADGAVLAAADIQRKLVPTGSVVLAHGANFMASYGEIVDASAGANIVTGSAYNDRLIGGPGDTLQGGLGADTYVLAAGDGATTINDQGADKAADEIVFDPASNITAAGLKVKQSGIDLVVQYGATDYLTLKGWIGQAGPVNAMNDLVELSDGQQLTLDQMVALSLLTPGQTTLRADWHGQTLNGTAGSDTFFGGVGNDVFNPGKGADTISGGAGADTLNFNAGDGAKNWNESAIAAHVLQFGAGISPSNLSVTQSGFGLVLKDGIAGDQITLSGAIGKTAAGAFDQLTVKFADGSQKTLEDLLGQSLQGATGGLSLSGDYQPNTLFGRPGDTLAGGGGSDTFRFDAGFGKETISDFTPTGAQADLMDFAAALFPDFAAVQGAMSQVGANTVITLDANDVITLANVQKTALTAANFAFR